MVSKKALFSRVLGGNKGLLIYGGACSHTPTAATGIGAGRANRRPAEDREHLQRRPIGPCKVSMNNLVKQERKELNNGYALRLGLTLADYCPAVKNSVSRDRLTAI